jgi:hypothetical protein
MARDFVIDLDNDADTIRTLGRDSSGGDHLVLVKKAGFRISRVMMLFPRPGDTVTLGDSDYPFESAAEGIAGADPDHPNLFTIKTPPLRKESASIQLRGKHYMLDWNPAQPPAERPGPHFRVFP